MTWFSIVWPTLLIIMTFRAILLAFTKILYKNRQTISLGINEDRIVRGVATPDERMQVFGAALFSGLFSLNVYMLAAFVTTVLWAVQKYL